MIVVARSHLNTLSSLRYKQHYKAEHGGRGGPNNRTGRSGQDLIIPVPLGTIIRDQETDEVLGELLEDGESLVVAKGGKRGYGNLHFLSATHQAPTRIEEGEKGERRMIACELKLLADVGLAGFPNAGKSTLLSSISAAKPKIADYPFTTLVPNLGVVELDRYGIDDRSFVVADVPGLLEGASDGKGLGLDFLKHLERTSILCFVIDAFSNPEEDPLESYIKLEKELKSYAPEMLKKKRIIVFNKVDLSLEDDYEALTKPFFDRGLETFIVSGSQRKGLKELIVRLEALVSQEKEGLLSDSSRHNDDDLVSPASHQIDVNLSL